MYSYLTHQSELYTDVLTLSTVGSLYGCNISVTTDQSSCTSNSDLRVQSE